MMSRALMAALSVAMLSPAMHDQHAALLGGAEPPVRSRGAPPITVDDFDRITAASLKRSRKNARRLRENGAAR